MKRIVTNIKFSLDKNNSLIGFVTKEGGSWKGCYDNDPRKTKIVVVDHELSPSMVPGYLYRCSIISMENEKGFICIAASMIMHNAKLEVTVDDKKYKVEVQFGNRTITYDPLNGKTRNIRDYHSALKALGKRKDISNIDEITSDFIDACQTINKLIG